MRNFGSIFNGTAFAFSTRRAFFAGAGVALGTGSTYPGRSTYLIFPPTRIAILPSDDSAAVDVFSIRGLGVPPERFSLFSFGSGKMPKP